jgi:hypothetical protein
MDEIVLIKEDMKEKGKKAEAKSKGKAKETSSSGDEKAEVEPFLSVHLMCYMD